VEEISLLKGKEKMKTISYIPFIVLTSLLVTFGQIHTSNLAIAVVGSKPLVPSEALSNSV
jgi:hypothetical protein